MCSVSKKSIAYKRDLYERGLCAENIAANYMANLGNVLIEQRFKTKYGEIDLILHSPEKKLLIFMEVKYRSAKRLKYCMVEAITSKQQTRHCDTAAYFLSLHNNYAECQCRFDLIIVSNGAIFAHIENAWQT